MALFDITINVFWVSLLMGLSLLLGFLWRSKQLKKKDRQIAELEKEMLFIHAEILDVQKEYCDLESRVKNLAIPVISIKQAAKEEEVKKEPKSGGTKGR
jgi:hypothetical protein